MVGDTDDGLWVTGPDTDAPVICDLVPRDAESFTEEDEANASLIAASPELLDACRYTLRWWNECGFDDEWHPSIRQKLERAIAKASQA